MRETEGEGEGRRDSMTDKMVIVQLLCRCPQCRAVNRFVINWNKPRSHSKCQGCGEIIPTDGYKVIVFTNDQRNPLF